MPKHPNHRPKTAKLEVAKRIKQVQAWIMEDLSRGEILERSIRKFKIQVRQAERYYEKAFDLFEAYNIMSIEKKRGFYIQRKRKLIQDIDPVYKRTPAGARTINKILDSMAEIEGVKKQKIELSGMVAIIDDEIDYSKLSDAALEEIAAARKPSGDGGTD